MTGFDLFLNFPLQIEFGTFQCYECDISFTDVNDALKHLTGHLPKDFDHESDGSSGFENFEYEPPEISNEDQTQARQKSLEMLSQPNETKCPQCDEIFNTLAAWGAHFQSAHAIKQVDDIPESSSIENIPDAKIGSTSQFDGEKSDHIPVTTSGENGQGIDVDPPSPVYRVRNMKRIRANSFSDTKSHVSEHIYSG